MHGAQIGTVLAPKNNAKDVFPASLLATGVEPAWRHRFMVREGGDHFTVLQMLSVLQLVIR